jgi:Methyltransferase domain
MTLTELIGNYDRPDSLGSKFRSRRSGALRSMILEVFERNGSVSILDVGGTERYWGIFPADFLLSNKVRITLSNRTEDVAVEAGARSDIFDPQAADGCDLPYRDNQFDICHSNSVIEHVGNWGRKSAFAREVVRVAPRYWHQTPNFWFPFEPHYGFPIFHWLPEPMRLAISLRRKLGWWPKAIDVDAGMFIIGNATLLDSRMFRYLFPNATIKREKVLGLTKSFIAVK